MDAPISCGNRSLWVLLMYVGKCNFADHQETMGMAIEDIPIIEVTQFCYFSFCPLYNLIFFFVK
jgi:hypothetical protein